MTEPVAFTSSAHTCAATQGLPLRWLEDAPSGATIEMRDICPLNEAGEPLERLDADDCWTIGPTESTLVQIPRRIPLRDLFP